MFRCIAAAVLFVAIAVDASAGPVDEPLDAQIEMSDIEAFFQIYDAAAGRPSATDLRAYIARPSPGIRGFMFRRIRSAENLAGAIAANAEAYANARTCAGQLGEVRQRVREGFSALESLYPEATYPTTYVVIGANNAGGTANSNALIIGLEVVCNSRARGDADIATHLVRTIVHEAIHPLQGGFRGGTVLSRSLNEGVAEFIAELIVGSVVNAHLTEWTRGREQAIEERFQREMHSRDHREWLYNGFGSPDAPGNLGYWVGYRIVRAYYEQHPDKRRAVREILEARDAQAFLAASGWRPQTGSGD